MMFNFSEDEGKRIQTLFGWGTIAYALGFITVMAHTARLGIPIIKILEPVYVWIGFPLAIVVFLSRWLWKLMDDSIQVYKSQNQLFKMELQRIRDDNTLSNETDEQAVAEYVRLFEKFLMLISRVSLAGHLLSAIPRIYFNFLFKTFKKQFPERKLTITVKEKKLFQSMILTFERFLNISSFVSNVIFILLVPLGCYLYIFNVYPLIPQSLGGGHPTPVVLMVDTEKIPFNSDNTRVLFPQTKESDSSDEKIFSTLELDLLYSTDNEYFVRVNKNPLISIKKDAVEGIIWLSNTRLQP